ncbi:hypothetical protein TNCV_3461641 [Trichonephila clavipes]|nr:hypothetical protein TNCV_3461641 [Trichonephila clavipes]
MIQWGKRVCEKCDLQRSLSIAGDGVFSETANETHCVDGPQLQDARETGHTGRSGHRGRRGYLPIHSSAMRLDKPVASPIHQSPGRCLHSTHS